MLTRWLSLWAWSRSSRSPRGSSTPADPRISQPRSSMEGNPRQVTLQATLGTIAERVREARIRPPAILVAGDVVSLREQLSWFENQPLFGLRVLVTRSRAQASSFVRGLRELGAAPIELPSIDIQPVDDSRELDLAICELSLHLIGSCSRAQTVCTRHSHGSRERQ